MEGLDKYLTNEPMTNDKWDGLYNIVYADPAWKFGSRLANGNDKNGIVNLKQVKIEDNYTVMTTDDICRLPIKNMTADDAKSIREQYALGKVTQKELAIQFNCSENHINRILSGKKWKL
jgi:DNA-binding transcriptional regulator YiaG